jgi:hypothetical protein
MLITLVPPGSNTVSTGFFDLVRAGPKELIPDGASLITNYATMSFFFQRV